MMKPGEWNWLGRSLENYKKQQAKIAESKGVASSLKSATSLTQARKIVYGLKKGQLK